jgi:hypothetical protein
MRQVGHAQLGYRKGLLHGEFKKEMLWKLFAIIYIFKTIL